MELRTHGVKMEHWLKCFRNISYGRLGNRHTESWFLLTELFTESVVCLVGLLVNTGILSNK
jgi:hypothetical protein